jgi:hypothetical protein
MNELYDLRCEVIDLLTECSDDAEVAIVAGII